MKAKKTTNLLREQASRRIRDKEENERWEETRSKMRENWKGREGE